MDIKDVRELASIIIKMIEDKKKTSYGRLADGWWTATVVTVDGVNNLATVALRGSATETDYKQNKTGQSLVIGDEVYLFSPYGTLGSAWIEVAKKKYV